MKLAILDENSKIMAAVELPDDILDWELRSKHNCETIINDYMGPLQDEARLCEESLKCDKKKNDE